MTSLNSAQVAESLQTTARHFRKFLRSDASPYEAVGQGARYTFSTADIPELKEAFDSWINGKTPSTQASPSGKTASPKRPKKRELLKVDPLAEDSPAMRLKYTIAERQRMHGITCSFSTPHPKVSGLRLFCKNSTADGTDYCIRHIPELFCGDIEDPGCGPGTGKPYCKYHNGDVSEEEFEAWQAGIAEIYDEMNS